MSKKLKLINIILLLAFMVQSVNITGVIAEEKVKTVQTFDITEEKPILVSNTETLGNNIAVAPTQNQPKVNNTVKPVVKQSINLDSNVYTLLPGNTKKVSLLLVNEDGTAAPIDKGIKYEIADASIATVAKDGTLTAKKLGETVLKVSYKELKAFAVVKVVNEIIMPPFLSLTEQSGAVVLSWTKPAEGVTYTIERGITPGFKYTLASKITGTTYSDKTIQKDFTYFYTVKAVKNGVESEESNIVIKTAVPSAPSLDAQRKNDGIRLAWTKPYGSAKYTLLKATQPGGPYESLLNKTAESRYTDTNITANATYYYIVKTYDTLGREGMPSSEKMVKPSDEELRKFDPKADNDGDQITNEEELIKGNDINGEDSQEKTNESKEVNKDKVDKGNNEKKKIVPKKIKRNFKSKDSKVNVDVYGDDDLNTAPLKIEESKDAAFLKGAKGIVGTPVDISAGGIDINSATITISYDRKQLKDISEDNLTIYWFDTENMKLVPLQNVKIDKKNMTVTADTPHFSIYVLGDVVVDLTLVDMVFAIDQSDSMRTNDAENYRLKLSDKFIRNLNSINGLDDEYSTPVPEQNRIRMGLIEISDFANVKLGIESPQSQLSDKQSQINHTLGSANIADGLLVSAGQLRSSDRRKIINLITDGKDTTGNTAQQLEKMALVLKEKKIVVNVVQVGNDAESQLLKNIADITGGSYFAVNLDEALTQQEKEEQINLIYEKLIKQITFQKLTDVPAGVMQKISKYPDIYKGTDNEENLKLYSTKTKTNLLTGNYINEVVDLKINSTGRSLVLSRTYNSQSGEKESRTVLGNGWRTSYDSKVSLKHGGFACVTASQLNVRSTAGISDNIMGYIMRGTYVQILDNTPVPASGYNWIKISLGDNITGYVVKDYITEQKNYVEVTYPSGTKDVFESDKNDSTIFRPIFGIYDELKYTSEGWYELTRKDQTKYTFNMKGFLVHIDDRFGNRIEISRNSADYTVEYVTELATGRKLTFSYKTINNEKLLWKVAESALSRYVEYMYDKYNNLVGVFDATGKKTTYAYENRYEVDETGVEKKDASGNPIFDRSLLTQIIDANGHQTVKNEYDVFDRMVKQYDANNNIRYNIYKDVYTDEQGAIIGSGELATYTIDENGNETKIVFNPVTLKPVREIDAKGDKVEHQYWIGTSEIPETISTQAYKAIKDAGSQNTKEIIIDKRGFKTTYEYDAKNNLVKLTDDNQKSEIYEYDTKNNLRKKTDKGNNITKYNYDTSMTYLTSIIDPMENEKVYTYYQENDATSILGIYIKIKGLVKTVKENRKSKNNTMINGFSVTEYKYEDPHNNCTEIIDTLGYSTKYQYDAAGRLKKLTNARNYDTKYEYDALDRLIVEEDAYGNKTRIQYDNVGNKRFVTDKNNNMTEYSYDNKNQLIKVIDPKGFSIQYAYDAKGNKTKEINQKGGITLYDYDYLGRLIKVTDPLNNVTKYTYDYFEGNRTCIENPEGGKTLIEYNNLYQKITEKKLQSNGQWLKIASYTYDANGNIGTIKEVVTGAREKETKYEYDGLNRQTKITEGVGEPDALLTEYSYAVFIDEEGNKFSSVEVTLPGKGILPTRITKKEYNPLGRLVKEVDGKQNAITYTYDEAGNLKTKTDAAQNTTTYHYDRLNRVKMIVDLAPLCIQKEYDANGNNTAGIDRKGKRTEYRYNVLNQLYEVVDPLGNITKYTYDQVGNKTSVIDAEGNTAYYEYNALGQLVSETDAMNNTKIYKYDGNGNKVWESIKRNTNIGTSYIYDKLGRLEKTIDPEGYTVIYTYYENGMVNTKTDADNSKVQYTYDLYNRVSQIEYPGDNSIPAYKEVYKYNVFGELLSKEEIKEVGSPNAIDIYEYDELGRQIAHIQKNKTTGMDAISTSVQYLDTENKRIETDGNGYTTTYLYDELGREKSVTKVVSGITQTTTYGYDFNGNRTTVTDWRGNTYTYEYDDSNRLKEKKDPYGKTIEKLEYYKNNLQKYSYDTVGFKTQYLYDANGRLISTIDPENHTTSQTYDADGNVSSKSDGKNNKTTYEYDFNNRLRAVINPKGEITSFSYDGNGNMLTQTDGRGYVTTYEYNTANKIKTRIDHGGANNVNKKESYTYYADGNLKTMTDRNGKITTYEYDVHDRLLSETKGSETITYTYDNNSNRLTINDSTGTTERTYDELGRVLTKTVPNIGKNTYQYDIITGMIEGCTAETSSDPKGNVTTKVYDKAGRLSKVTANGQTTTYSYYDNGSRKGVEYPDGSSETYTYYADNLLQTLVNKKADGTIIDSYSYEYDGAHNQIKKTDSKGSTNYSYDSLNRLVKVTEPNGRITEYTYDASGNRSTETVKFNGSTTVNLYVYNEQNRLTDIITKVNGSQQTLTHYTYDNNGNQLTTDVNGTVTVSNTYDVFNQLVKTVANGSTVTSTYNGEGYRVTKTVDSTSTRYLYEYDKVVLEIDAATGNQTARNIYGTNLLVKMADGQTYYYMYNGHADVTALLKPDGTIAGTYYYDAFGNVQEHTGTDSNITYAGYQYDKETGLYYLNSRMYDPKIARFLQEDTYRGVASDPLSLNLYTYCRNEPLMYTDPDGHVYIKNEHDAAAYAKEIEEAGITDLNPKSPEAAAKLASIDSKRPQSTYYSSPKSAEEAIKRYGHKDEYTLWKEDIDIAYIYCQKAYEDKDNIFNQKLRSNVDLFMSGKSFNGAPNFNQLDTDSVEYKEAFIIAVLNANGMMQFAEDQYNQKIKSEGFMAGAMLGSKASSINMGQFKEIFKNLKLGAKKAGNVGKKFWNDEGGYIKLPGGGGTKTGNVDKGTVNSGPQNYLNTALKRQGLNTAPNRLKETWIEGDYKYEVRIHEAETQYGKTGSIYRVSRQRVNLPAGQQGTGVEYMDTNGNWYNQSVLKEKFKDGSLNPNFNEAAAKDTHIQLP